MTTMRAALFQMTSGIDPAANAAAIVAMAARARGARRSVRPAAWVTSTTTGRWVSCLARATAERSRVLRVQRSKVRIPLSARITCSFP